MEYEHIECACGQQARIVVTGVGTYIHCPYCGAETCMQTTQEKAIREFKEQYGQEEKESWD